MKKILLSIILELFFSVILFSGNATAGTYDNAIKYYQTYGDSKLAMLNDNDGYIYFCSAGKTSTGSTKYKTVGYKITLHADTENDTVEVKLGGSIIKDVSEMDQGGYTYVLRRAKLSSLQLLFNGNNKITWNQIFRCRNSYEFNAIMTVEKNGKQLCGTVTESSDKRKLSAASPGNLYRKANDIKKAEKWANPSDLNSFFGKYIDFDPVNGIKIDSMDIAKGDNVYHSDDVYYVKKDSVIKLSIKSSLKDQAGADNNYHPNYNIINASSGDKTQLFNISQGKTKGKCTGGLLGKTGGGNDFLSYVDVVKNDCTGSDDSLNYFKSCAEYTFNLNDSKSTNIIPEARIYYASNYPKKDAEKKDLCDVVVDRKKVKTLVSDAKSPTIDAKQYLTNMGGGYIPFTVCDNGSGIRKINIYKSDGTLLITKDYSKNRTTVVSSENDYYLYVTNGMQIYITAEDNVGNVSKSSYITFSVPTAHTVQASVSKGLNGYNCNNVTSYVYGGNTEIASFVIMSDDDENDAKKRVVLECLDVAAKTMPAGLYSYVHSIDPMGILGAFKDGSYNFNVISGGRYVSSEPYVFNIRKDTTPPEARFITGWGTNGWFRTYASFALEASDNYSGLDGVDVVCDSEILQHSFRREDVPGYKEYKRYTLYKEGINELEAVITDKAGNTKKVRETVKIDATPPDYVLPDAFLGASIKNDIWITREQFKSQIIISDDLSGFKEDKDYFVLYSKKDGCTRQVDDNNIYGIALLDDHHVRFRFVNSYANTIKSGQYIYMLEAMDNVDNNKMIILNLNIDADPPKADLKTDDPWSPEDRKGYIHFSDEHSGIDSIIVMCDGEETDRICGIGKNEYSMYVDVSDIPKDMPEVHIIVTDNVGNSMDYMPQIDEKLSLTAEIIRHSDGGEPVFFSGEKGDLNISIKGKADRLVISYPDGMREYDNDILLTPKETYNQNQIFNIPLDYENGISEVEVKAFRKGKCVTAIPAFEVTGKLTDSIRTRLRVRV